LTPLVVLPSCGLYKAKHTLLMHTTATSSCAYAYIIDTLQVGRVSGQRVVFDGEGNAQDPLALLALEGLGGDGDASGEGDEEGPAAGLHVTGDAPEARFKAAADAMRR
jgi:hypothetical protein